CVRLFHSGVVSAPRHDKYRYRIAGRSIYIRENSIPKFPWRRVNLVDLPELHGRVKPIDRSRWLRRRRDRKALQRRLRSRWRNRTQVVRSGSTSTWSSLCHPMEMKTRFGHATEG